MGGTGRALARVNYATQAKLFGSVRTASMAAERMERAYRLKARIRPVAIGEEATAKDAEGAKDGKAELGSG